MSEQTIERPTTQFVDGQIAAVHLLGRINVAIRRDGSWRVARGQFDPEPSLLSDKVIARDGQILDIPKAWGLAPDEIVAQPGGGRTPTASDAWDVHQEQI